MVYIGYSPYIPVQCRKIWFIYDMVYTYIYTMVYVRYVYTVWYILDIYTKWYIKYDIHIYGMVYIGCICIGYGIYTIWHRAGPVARSKYELGGSRQQKQTERDR